MGNYRPPLVLFVVALILVTSIADAFAFQQDIDRFNRFLAGIALFIMTIIVVIMFRTNEWFEDKWYFASSYQRAVSLGIGIPLWIAILAFIIGGFGNIVGAIMVLVSFAVIAPHTRRWKRRRRIGSSYSKRTESYDDKTYGSRSNSESNYYNPNERTHYKETSGHEETYDRQEESRQYSNESDYREYEREEDQHNEEQYEDEESSPDTALKKCYEVLDVAENASPDEIKKAYKRLVKQWHPDNHKSDKRKQIAEQEMKKINEAYEMLEKAGRVK